MRRGWVGLAVLAAVVLVVVLLREPPAKSPEPPPSSVAPVVMHADRVTPLGSRLNWREVPLPAGIEQAHRSAVDVERAVFPVLAQDGTHRLVTEDGAEVARGAETLSAMVDGTRLVVHEAEAGRLSTVDLVAGARTGQYTGAKPGPVAVAAGLVVVQRSDQCLVVLDAATLQPKMDRCTPDGTTISLLTAELDSVQWREVRSGEHCVRWFRMGAALTPEVLSTGERACRAAVLLHTADWELTADFPPYEVGVADPGPLMARRGNIELILDANAVNVHTCGGRVYWLSQAVGAERLGQLVRWAPGQTRVDVLEIDEGSASPPRCVNGVLNVVTHGADRPRLWTLAEP
ncbi:hypothetical protein [Kibdelosporangium phytohabitans]|uniref:Uncharacterized protein n=1 Tax=Kibdelosporangium phytohabitans TaxID=860235 RepID=A0A0N7F3D5_9PSEU|nr:hypothetical protein [Kibdelosporangium phytohabitans]ALG08327.1 hypothetical protein AOZ06_16685 [Kibdelosporangium phytohabitans]MBE1470640.1 hypothetical protein [Kibdelosporangium phytohabitans]